MSMGGPIEPVPTQNLEEQAGILHRVSSIACSIHVSSWVEKVCFLREEGGISIIEQNNKGWMWALEKVIFTKRTSWEVLFRHA